MIQTVGIDRRDRAAVAEDGNAAGDPEHLVEVVTYEEHRLPGLGVAA